MDHLISFAGSSPSLHIRHKLHRHIAHTQTAHKSHTADISFWYSGKWRKRGHRHNHPTPEGTPTGKTLLFSRVKKETYLWTPVTLSKQLLFLSNSQCKIFAFVTNVRTLLSGRKLLQAAMNIFAADG